MTDLTPETITRLFTRSDGSFLFARWGRPIVPVVFGADDASLPAIKGGIEAVVTLAGHKMAETDPEQGANLMMFFFRDWAEVLDVPDLDRLVPGLQGIVDQVTAAGANQYRVFRFDPDGAIRAAVVFVQMDAAMSDVPAQDLALFQAVQTILLWSDRAFSDRAPLARAGEVAVVPPDLAAVIRAAYDPILPNAAQDAAHGLRLAARVLAGR